MVDNTLNVESWLRFWQPEPLARLRLFCFPYAGGGAAIFRHWAEQLPPDVEVCPVQLPGRENRIIEKPFTQVSALIEALVPALLPMLNKPYAFFGHSMGATVAFELACALKKQGHSQLPTHLYVAGRRAPQIPASDPPTYHLPRDEFIAELRRLEGTPEEVLANVDLLEFLLPLLRADFALSQAYTYTSGEALDCPITAFGGTQDNEVSLDELAGWKVQTRKQFTLKTFPGGHFFLNTQSTPLLQTLSLMLTQDIQGDNNA